MTNGIHSGCQETEGHITSDMQLKNGMIVIFKYFQRAVTLLRGRGIRIFSFFLFFFAFVFSKGQKFKGGKLFQLSTEKMTFA